MCALRHVVVLACLVCAFMHDGSAQSQGPVPAFPPPDTIPEALSFFAPFFIPKALQDEYQLKDYIRSEEFRQFRNTYGDLYAVDAIFDRAMHLCWNNTYEALGICLLATFDHRNVGVRFPLVGALLWVPLTAEFPDEFHERVDALPTRIYSDSPHDRYGDRDKLQHFFGSAFLTYLTESYEESDAVGIFVEWGEERFIVGGVYDLRDVRANRQGQQFALCLFRNKWVRPSRFLVASPPPGPLPVPCQDYTADPDSLQSTKENQ